MSRERFDVVDKIAENFLLSRYGVENTRYRISLKDGRSPSYHALSKVKRILFENI